MGESKSRIEPVTCPDCGVRGEVRLAQSGFKNNFPNVVQCKHRQGMAVVNVVTLLGRGTGRYSNGDQPVANYTHHQNVNDCCFA